MKILHLSTMLTWGGGERQILNLCQALAQQAVTQWVVCPKQSALARQLATLNLPCNTLKKYSSVSLAYAYQLSKQIKHFQPDIVHVHDSHALTGITLAQILFATSVPIVISRKVSYPIKDTAFSRFKYNQNSVKKIICVSNQVKKVVAKTVKQPACLTTIYDGIDLNQFTDATQTNPLRQEFSLSQTSLLIGCVASLLPVKDHKTFIDCAKQVLSAGIDAKFFIIGDGPLKSELAAYVKSLQLDHAIIFTGFRNDIANIMPALDILMLTSTAEGMGTVLLEAMAAKVAVIATAAGGVIEAVQNKVTGLIANVGDTQTLAHHVITLAQNPALRNQLVQQAHQHVQRFSSANSAKQVLNTYIDILKKPKPYHA